MAEKEKEKKAKPSGPKKVRKKVKKNVAHLGMNQFLLFF